MSLSQAHITQRLMLAWHVDSEGGIQDVRLWRVGSLQLDRGSLQAPLRMPRC